MSTKLIIGGIDVTEVIDGKIEFSDYTEDTLFAYRVDEFRAKCDQEIFELFDISLFNARDFLNKEALVYYNGGLVFGGLVKEAEYTSTETLQLTCYSYGKIFAKTPIFPEGSRDNLPEEFNNIDSNGDSILTIADRLIFQFNSNQNRGYIDEPFQMAWRPVIAVDDFNFLKSVKTNKISPGGNFPIRETYAPTNDGNLRQYGEKGKGIHIEVSTGNAVFLYGFDSPALFSPNFRWFIRYDFSNTGLRTASRKQDAIYYTDDDGLTHYKILGTNTDGTYIIDEQPTYVHKDWQEEIFKQIAIDEYDLENYGGSGYSSEAEKYYFAYIKNHPEDEPRDYFLLRYEISDEDLFRYKYTGGNIGDIMKDVCKLKNCLTWVDPNKVLHFISREGTETEITKEPIKFTYNSEAEKKEITIPDAFLLLKETENDILNWLYDTLGNSPTHFKADFLAQDFDKTELPLKGARLFLLIEGKKIPAGMIKSTSYKSDEIITVESELRS